MSDTVRRAARGFTGSQPSLPVQRPVSVVMCQDDTPRELFTSTCAPVGPGSDAELDLPAVPSWTPSNSSGSAKWRRRFEKGEFKWKTEFVALALDAPLLRGRRCISFR